MVRTQNDPPYLHPLGFVRQARGWTHQDVADIIASTSARLGLGGMAARREKIWRWEHRDVRPDRASQQALAVALGVSLERVDALPWPHWLPAGDAIRSDFAWTVEGARAALHDAGQLAGQDRRGFLQLTGTALTAVAGGWAGAEAERLGAATGGGRLDNDLLGWCERKIPWLRRLDDQMAGESLRRLVDAELRIVTELLDRASYTDAQAVRLHAAAAELGQLAGWVSFDGGLHAGAQRYYLAGLHAAHAADNRLLAANVLAGLSFQATLTDHPAEGVALARAARDSIDATQSPRVASMLASREARAHARAGDVSACELALHAAETHLDRADGSAERTDDPAWIYYFDDAEMSAQVGACWLDLNLPRAALSGLDHALAGMDPTYVRDRTIYHVRTATAHLQLGDLEGSVAQTANAAELAAGGGSRRTIEAIRELRGRLQRYASEPSVRALDEKLRPVTAA